MSVWFFWRLVRTEADLPALAAGHSAVVARCQRRNRVTGEGLSNTPFPGDRAYLDLLTWFLFGFQNRYPVHPDLGSISSFNYQNHLSR